VEQVVTFARTAAERSIGDAEALLAAVKSGDAAAAKAAYVKLRPAYEQIEHLYAVLGDTDMCVCIDVLGFRHMCCSIVPSEDLPPMVPRCVLL
jgi:iron uptake system EfeUOB component EfeO/EfeM